MVVQTGSVGANSYGTANHAAVRLAIYRELGNRLVDMAVTTVSRSRGLKKSGSFFVCFVLETMVFAVLPLSARLPINALLLAFSRLSALATDHQLSVYDAAYLELAQRRKLVLGCKDGALRKAAKQAGVTLWD